MLEYDDQFIEGFAKEAKAAGVPDEQIPELLSMYVLRDLLEKDAAFREGFEAEMAKHGQHFWKNMMGGAAIGAGAGAAFGGIGALPGAVIGGLAGGARGIYKNIRNPQNVANRYNQQRQQYMQQRQQMDTMYGMGPGGGQGGFPRPGYGMPRRWNSGYGEPGWY